MKKNLFLLFIVICSTIIGSAQVSSWEEFLTNKKGEVQINYYNSENFISDASGEIVGIEYDLLESFFSYCEQKYQIEIKRNYVKAKSFSALYNNIKSNAQSGEFASCSFSMTPERMEEVQFSPKYMPDIEVLICSHNIPIATDTAHFIELFKNKTAFTIENTTFDDDVKRIKNIIPSLKIENVASALEIRDRVSIEDNLLSYIELPNYILALKKGVNLKRQFLFKVERWGYGFIYPLNSDWKSPIEDYFASNEFKNEMAIIISKHLGNDVNELILDLANTNNKTDNKEVSLLNKEREIQELEIEKQKIELKAEQFWKYIILIGSLFVIVIAFLLFQQNKLKQKSNELLTSQNKEITEQNKIIEDKNEHIISSIRYAEKIQHAALPSNLEIKEIFPESFVYYQPKDTLSGDFYWVGNTKSSNNDVFSLLAVGDCTGHGVPGALLSLLGINHLNIARKKSDINSPAEALDFLNQGIIQTFTSNDKSIADGMDIAMLAIENSSLMMYYAAAINSIYVIRSNKLIDLKGDRFSIGKNYFMDNKKFNAKEFQLIQGDMIYLFSDGYPDQFGGSKDKKIGYRSFKNLLVENHTASMDQQEENLKHILNIWKGKGEQTDDICVFGLEV